MSKILIQFIVFALPMYVLIQSVTSKDLKHVNVKTSVFDGLNVTDIIDFFLNEKEIICSYKTEYKKELTSSGRRISEIKYLEYVLESICYKIHFDQHELPVLNRFGRAINSSERSPTFSEQLPQRGLLEERASSSARVRRAGIVKGGRSVSYGIYRNMDPMRSLSTQRDKWIFKCGATLISKKSSANCTYIPKRDKTVSSQTPEIVKMGDKFIEKVKTSVFDGLNVTDIIDFFLNKKEIICSYKTEYKKELTSPGRRISEIKCLEYVLESICYKIHFDRHGLPVLNRFGRAANSSERSPTLSEQLPQRGLFEERASSSARVRRGAISGGGRPVYYREYPHMGALGWLSAQKDKWIFKCGATLISNKFMLTSAHCTYIPKRDKTVSSRTPEIVKMGDKFIEKDPHPIEMEPLYILIIRIIKYKKYQPPKHYYDIAIIELEDTVSISALTRPACLWSSSDTSQLNKVSVTGWGVVDPVTRETSNDLQVAEIDIIDDNNCDKLLKTRRNRKWSGLADHQMCAGYLPGGIDTCQGDSGGPLQVKLDDKLPWPMYYLVGVTSFGFTNGCGNADTPSIYVKTSSFIDWIEKIVWANE